MSYPKTILEKIEHAASKAANSIRVDTVEERAARMALQAFSREIYEFIQEERVIEEDRQRGFREADEEQWRDDQN